MPLRNAKVRIVLWALFWFIVIGVGFEYATRAQLLFANKKVRSVLLNNYPSQDLASLLVLRDHIDSHPEGMLRFVLMGESQVGKCITDSDGVTQMIRDSLQTDAMFLNVATAYGNFYDILRIQDEFSDTDQMVYLLGISPRYFSWADSIQVYYDVEKNGSRTLHYKYPMLPPSKEGMRIVNEYWDVPLRGYSAGYQTTYSLAKVVSSIYKIILFRKLLPSMSDKVETPKAVQYTVAQYKWFMYEWFQHQYPTLLEQYCKMNRELLEACIVEAKKQGNRVILVDLPLTPMIENDREKLACGYEDYLNSISADMGVPVISLRHDVYVEEDFVDGIHMSESGQEKTGKLLAHELKGWYEEAVNR